MRDDNFHNERVGFIVLIEDISHLRMTVEKVCKAFAPTDTAKLFELIPKDVVADLKEAQN